MLFTTGEINKMTGLTERTIRYYFRLGLLKSKMSEKGQLVLQKSDLERIEQILAAKIAGYKLKDLIDRHPPKESIKHGLTQMITELEYILFHLDQSASDESLMECVKLLHHFNTRYLRKK